MLKFSKYVLILCMDFLETITASMLVCRQLLKATSFSLLKATSFSLLQPDQKQIKFNHSFCHSNPRRHIKTL